MKLKNTLNKKLKNYRVLQNINKDYTKNQKSILIIYLDDNYYNTNVNRNHTNQIESQQIVKVLSELDFCIDLTSCMNDLALDIIGNKSYDYILGLGDIFYEMCKRNPKAIKILYATENPPWISTPKELERINYFYERTGRKEVITRSNIFYKREHFEDIDFCITLGEIKYYNDCLFKTYRMYPTFLENKKFKLTYRGKCNKNFLWFGSNGAIHKGLDILIDIFKKQKDYNLYICGMSDRDKKIIDWKHNNIINLGRVDVYSEEFIKIINECDYLLFPSCSEATSTAVLTVMRHGVIPIVTEGIGFDSFSDKCILLNDFKKEYIEDLILKQISNDYNEIYDMRNNIIDFTKKKFNITEFTKSFELIMRDIIKQTCIQEDRD